MSAVEEQEGREWVQHPLQDPARDQPPDQPARGAKQPERWRHEG